jgi:hypothetical protein
MDGGHWPPEGGPWEGGCTDSHGTQWVHIPWEGWQHDTTTPVPTPQHGPIGTVWDLLRGRNRVTVWWPQTTRKTGRVPHPGIARRTNEREET